MIVISDTSPITNLYQIGHLSLLKDLYGSVIIPSAVRQELVSLSEQADLLEQESWIEVAAPSDQSLLNTLLKGLDLGEAEAIVLALELGPTIC